MKKPLILAAALALLAAPALAVRIECITANTIQTDANCTGADEPWDCCTGSGTGNCLDISATAIRVKGGNLNADIELYSTAEIDPDEDNGAPAVPATCTVGGSITCSGFPAGAEIWTKCDRRAPFEQMNNTSTYTANVKVGVSLESDCLIVLKVDTPANSCMYLAVTHEKGLDPQDAAKTTVQDGSAKSWWAEVVP